MFKGLLSAIFRKRRKRINYVCCTYLAAEHLLKDGWTIAKEEDKNKKIGFVCLEYLEPQPPAGQGD